MKLVSKQLTWFAANARDLPWRHTLDPYAIWVSEIMLQQTQVKTVIPYFDRWLRELPNATALAKAQPERVLKLWEGLGYYTRARSLQKAAQQIVNQHAGEFPRDFDAILDLPGIGRYTAGAIASIAFNQPRPIVDGNVIRVLTRVFGIQENPREKTTNEKVWHLAEQLVTAAAKFPKSALRNHHSAILLSGPCSALNQSLMELGATICQPRNPNCSSCPLKDDCVANKKNLTAQLPNLGERTKATARQFFAVVAEHNGRVLVRQRPKESLNGSLWEFPNLEVTGDGHDPAALAETLLNDRTVVLKPLCTIKHSITRYRITLTAHVANLAASPAPRAPEGRWTPFSELDQLAFTSAHRKVFQHYAKHRAGNKRSKPVRKRLS